MPLIGTRGAASSRGFGRFGGAPGLFNMPLNVTYTLRPRRFGSYGTTSSDWDSSFAAYGVPWYGVAGALQYTAHPQESARGNPAPGHIFGVTGFPSGTYRFELAGAAGADADPGFGAPGGLGVADMAVSPSDVLWFAIGQGGIYTGGATRSDHAPWYYPNPGGWNGGGAAGAQNSNSMYSGSGGGGTDIRLNGTALTDRIMVVGGGGGSTDQNYNTGGQGGGFNQNGQDGGNNGNANGAKGGTLSAGGSGALYNGTLYDTYMNGSLWAGGRGYDGSQPVSSANAAGGGGGGYYGGGGAVDEQGSNMSGTGGGSGYADTSKVTVVSATAGGANNGNPSWTWSNPSVNGNGKTSFIDWDGSTFDPTNTSSDSARYTTYRSDGRTINRRFGNNGWIKITKIS